MLKLNLFGYWQTEQYVPPPAIDVSALLFSQTDLNSVPSLLHWSFELH